MATSHPFPTLWPAKDGAAVLIQLLPSKDEIFLYLDAFQQRAQSCSFPHVPEECTKKEVERFLANVEHNALVHPDMLALLFTTLAQGLQSGVYDRGGGQWVAGAMDEDSKKGDVYSKTDMLLPLMNTDSTSRRCNASSANSIVYEQTFTTRHSNTNHDLSVFNQQRQIPRCMGVIWRNN